MQLRRQILTTHLRPAQASTSLITCNNRTFLALSTVNRRLTIASNNILAVCKSNRQRCTQLEKAARRTSRSGSTTSRVTSHSEYEPPTEAHNATLLMSKSNLLGLIHKSKSTIKVSRVPFGNSFTTNQKVEGVIISLKYI